ncbi:hypothetical protein R1sor_021141 [Riccia sorocarpa]|uniref:Uncharacterized protein n=1 Tax=Riccia sorocarpa TaxID=122646 RepID=A0ABD3GJD0_9MARC
MTHKEHGEVFLYNRHKIHKLVEDHDLFFVMHEGKVLDVKVDFDKHALLQTAKKMIDRLAERKANIKRHQKNMATMTRNAKSAVKNPDSNAKNMIQVSTEQVSSPLEVSESKGLDGEATGEAMELESTMGLETTKCKNPHQSGLEAKTETEGPKTTRTKDLELASASHAKGLESTKYKNL